MIRESIKKELEKHKNKPDIIKIWYIKEYLQTIVLKQMYELRETKDLIFYGGTSLRFLFWLNRLSEDLDFIGQNFDGFEIVAKHLQSFFVSDGVDIQVKMQKFRIMLNFKDFLSDFGINFWASKDLYLKIEISEHFAFCKNYQIKLYPIFKYNQSLVIKSLDKSSLFSTKLNAVLYRNWTKQIWEEKISVKWRDIYDLFWYLSNSFQPNIDCIDGVVSMDDLKQKLKTIIEKIDFKEVILDIENFLEDDTLLEFMKNNGKEYILEQIDML
ncbi:MAG: hypothetical protein ACD_71C00185G0002 [uncultured bacterium (gcode 4)]|uniref:Nucleotidyl transferase AbiEii/AbiGii toxin family protein n=1 Tax=uncultured bacterium (gcode 4) TaxID=1234023 RepID=K1Z4U0_9BACT|nr:MAG: hypothetical protein ACD_71C00185G0002 [uncultured bacterium (gcode 4)]